MHLHRSCLTINCMLRALIVGGSPMKMELGKTKFALAETTSSDPCIVVVTILIDPDLGGARARTRRVEILGLPRRHNLILSACDI